MTQLDLTNARNARDVALERVQFPDPNSAFIDLTTELLEEHIHPGDTFLIDHAWTLIEATEWWPELSELVEPRALGAVIVKLSRRGVIEKTGEYKQSARRSCHANPRPVWRWLGEAA